MVLSVGLYKLINNFLDVLAGLVMVLIFLPLAFLWYMIDVVYCSTKRIFTGEHYSPR